MPSLPDSGLVRGADGIVRCAWGASHPLYLPYHDEEWGRPVASDQRLFEKVCLEGFQSGLSWLTILKKRPAFRAAFHDFDIEKVARMGEPDVQRLLQNAAIVRHRKKIEATINNAGKALDLIEAHGSLAAWLWTWEPPRRPAALDWATLRKQGQTAQSVALSKALKKQGWRFVGPTTAYAFMQAMGLVNDHIAGCAFHAPTEAARAAFTPPLAISGDAATSGHAAASGDGANRSADPA